MNVSYKVHKVLYGSGYSVTFYCDGLPDYNAHGTYGTACKIFDTEKQAIRSGKRYIKTMVARGFENGMIFPEEV